MKRPWALPLVPLYAAGTALRSLALRQGWEKINHLTAPVISIGNISAGGTGKTPFVIALAQLLHRQGIPGDILSRGYGRNTAHAERVNPNGSAAQFGDEPLLIARQTDLPVYVAAKRFEAGQLAEAATPQSKLHLLDDGFQHRQLARDIDIVLINSEDLADSLLPAGNLRESRSALKRANIFAIDSADEPAATRLRALQLTQPIWRYRREMQVPKIAGPVVAFCGIARPSQFFRGLEQSGLQLAARHAFSDHHSYTPQDLQHLNDLAKTSKATALITTEKDQIRLPNPNFALPLQTTPLRITFEDEPTIQSFLQTHLKQTKPHP
ncbi:tetraacyldisaccharide 4'-kinase [Acidicapsa ligni]|uniref:tetraacyldisaccharide 4'-kinase n=1 Tax=Acidicapsa ligni TaxID=542300 RepID=UPI0021DF53AE|nr:tetraacyldisaccharide 4'-kinase [Acidicapsa ligni]